MAGGNKERALLLMADHVKAANAIYKNTDFNDDGKFEGRLNLYSSTLLCIVLYMYIHQACSILNKD